MRTLNNREKILIGIAMAGIAILALVLVTGGSKNFAGSRAEYSQLLAQVEQLKRRLKPYEERVPVVEKLMKTFQMDPAKLSKASVVGQASSAIQKTAASGGVQLGPIRESSGRGSAKELASIKLEGSGQLPAVMAFLQRLETLGYPLIIDSVQINADSKGPGMIKLTLTITIMDFEQWKPEGVPHV
jgi:hypothetical protein